MISFFIIAGLVTVLMHIVVGGWFFLLFPKLGWKLSVVFLPLLLTVLTFCTLSYTRTHYGRVENILYYAAYIWLGLVFILFSLVILFTLLQIILNILHIPHVRAILGPTSLLAIFVAAGVAIWGGFSQPKIKHIYIQIPGAPKMTAAVISDSHLGMGVSLARWEKALARLQAEKPDAIFVLGDVFEYGPDREKYAQALADLHTPLGTYGVLGNHEYYVGLQNSINFYKQAGIELLQNQIGILPNNVQVIGVNDIQTARVSAQQLDKLLAQTDPNAPRILLSHQPLLTDTAAAHQIPLMLSGHTHAGQIWPFTYLVKLHYPYVYGLHQTGPESRLYITSGMFYWGMPLRLFTLAEIPFIHIN